jgi:murein DD-endopeptidase MepM/ murein hydrolase activator NlpD
MSLRDSRPRPKSPRLLYFFSRARGGDIRTFALRPVTLWSLLAIVAVSLAWGGAATLYLVFRDDMLSALAARQAEMQYAYEDRLAKARAELDRVAGRQLLDQNSFEGKLHELLSRQAQLEQRGSIVAALVDEASHDIAAATPARPRVASAVRARATALSAIGAANPSSVSDSVIGPAAQAFAPPEPLAAPPLQSAPKPSPVEEPRQHVSINEKADGEHNAAAELAAAAEDRALGASARLSLIAYSLDRLERRQNAALGEIDATARRGAARLAAVVAETGLSADALVAPPAKGGVGGPFIPASVDAGAPAFDKALARAESDVARADRLRRLMPILPVRSPLIGEAEVSSPFGYRPDPFLGRPALHPGVDLVQDYGAEIHATAAGRVVHAGPMGGYGEMVEIDHGNGLATRYGHMSEILVEEGQEVKAGAVLGRLGSTGRSTGPHLHYEVRVDGEPVDPERFLQAGAPLFAAE